MGIDTIKGTVIKKIVRNFKTSIHIMSNSDNSDVKDCLFWNNAGKMPKDLRGKKRVNDMSRLHWH